MKSLTDEMVIARTKTSDLSNVKKLNCWGSELTDVSILRRMNNVEVLSLSLNKINSLADFQNCHMLKELYIRQNNVKNLNEICYLQSLPNLKNLWLAENPCASTDGYRLTVIRTLPQLEKLDNIEITPDEVQQANRRGLMLSHPEDEDQNQQSDQYWDYNRGRRGSPETYSPPPTNEESPPTTYDTMIGGANEDQYYDNTNSTNTGQQYYGSTNGHSSPPKKYDSENNRRSYNQTYSHENESEDYRHTSDNNDQVKHYRPAYELNNGTNINNERLSQNGDSPDREEKLTTSFSVNSLKDYNSKHRGENGSDYDHLKHRDSRERLCERAKCQINHPQLNRRPVTRNSNILSAVLCLIKELDYPSLEVVEMSVRCRMAEFDE